MTTKEAAPVSVEVEPTVEVQEVEAATMVEVMTDETERQ